MFSAHESPTLGLHSLMRGGTAPSFSFSRPFSRQGARSGQANANAGSPAPPVGGLVGIAAHAGSSRKTPTYSSSHAGGHGSSTGTAKLGATTGVSKGRKTGSDRAPVKSVAGANPGRAAIARPPPAHIVLDAPPLSPQGRKTRAIHEALRCIHLSPSHRSHAAAADITASKPHAAAPTSPLASYLAKSSSTTRIGAGHRLQSAKGPGPNKTSKLMTGERKKRNKSASAASRRRREEAGLQQDEMRSFLRTEDPILLPDDASDGDGEEEEEEEEGDYMRRFASELQLLSMGQGGQPLAPPLLAGHVAQVGQGGGAGAAGGAMFFADQQQGQQRPPSRQKDAFPVHLADFEDLMPPKKRKDAFQVEVSEATQQHIKTTRKTASENPRPPSRHKPPATALFLEIPPSDVEDTPSFSAELAPSWPMGRKQPVVDNRTDDPERDGFTCLDDGTPCPFKIEVTTELESDDESEGGSHTGHSLLQKPATAHAPLGPTVPPPSAFVGPATAAVKTRPFAALFEPSSVFAKLKVDTSPGKRDAAKQRAAEWMSGLDVPASRCFTPGRTPSPPCNTAPAVTPLLQCPRSASPRSGPTLSSTASTCSATSCATRTPHERVGPASPSSPAAATVGVGVGRPFFVSPPASAAVCVPHGRGGNQAHERDGMMEQETTRSPEWALSSAHWDDEDAAAANGGSGNGKAGASNGKGGRQGRRKDSNGHGHGNGNGNGGGSVLHWGTGAGFMRRSGNGGATAPSAFSDVSGGMSDAGSGSLWGTWSLESNLGEEFLSLFAPQHDESNGVRPMLAV